VTRLLCCLILLAFVAGCGATETVTVTNSVTVDSTAKQGLDQTAPWMPIASGFWLRARIDTVRSLDQQYRP
jgi:hypothetical protein